MAGGKLTPRQKMINLMYLVFVAMLALNMSKEVLSAFGLMNEKFEGSNTASIASNKQMLESLDKKAAESKGDFIAAAATSHKVETVTKNFYDYLAKLKTDVLVGTEVDPETGKLPYESMDKADNIDHLWFAPEGYSDKGKEVVATIEKFKADIKTAVGTDPKYKTLLDEIGKKFDLSKVKNKDGIEIDYLDYHYKGFPAVASLAKLTAWQNDVKKAESDVYSAALGKAAVSEASYSKFQAIVVLDKNAYFQGETVTGKVVLGKYDPNAQFSGFKGPGKLVNGQAVLSMTAGGVGEQNIGGSFNFMENGKPINLPFKGTYVVVPKPNSATISADKMNVVYRGVVNPISVSFAGIGEDKVSASAPGLSPAGGRGKYNMSPGQGSEVKIVCSGKLPNGQTVSDSKSFRIKGIPAPAGTVRGEDGVVKGPKTSLAVSTVGAKMIDFDFEVGLNVVGFNFKVPGQATVVVQGSKITPQCVAAMSKAGRGDQVTISEIKTKLVGSTLMLQKTSAVIYEITQ